MKNSLATYDTLFQMMEDDGYASWVIHLIVHRGGAPLEINIPHVYGDARYLQKEVFPIIKKIVSDIDPDTQTDIKNNVAKIETKERSTFQLFLESYLENDCEFVSGDTFAIAVDVRNTGILDLGNIVRNQVAFPVYEFDELKQLVREPRAVWKKRLHSDSARQLDQVDGIIKHLRTSPLEKRLRLWEKLEVNRCSELISYWGSLDQCLSREIAGKISCSVSTTAGPKAVTVMYSVGGKIIKSTSCV